MEQRSQRIKEAMDAGDLARLRQLLAAYEFLEYAKDPRATLLHLACSQNRREVVEFLLAHPVCSCEVNARDSYGDTPLHRGVAFNGWELVPLLLLAGADINAVGEGGETPLFHAVTNGHVNSVAELLKDPRVDLDVVSKDGHTAVSASTVTCPGVLEMLIEAGASLDVTPGYMYDCLRLCAFLDNFLIATCHALNHPIRAKRRTLRLALRRALHPKAQAWIIVADQKTGDLV
jgi:Ankyrin repeats (3 copies)